MRYISIVIAVVLFLIADVAGFNVYESTSVGLATYFFMQFIADFGKSIWSIMDIPIILAFLTWLILPLSSYHYFNESNALATTWDRVMRVDSITYYAFLLPATVAMALGIKLPFFKPIELRMSMAEFQQQGLFKRIPTIGYQLIGLSLFASVFQSLLPAGVRFVVYLVIKLLFVGLFYLYFSSKKQKNYILVLGFVIQLLVSIRLGMFGDLVYMTALALVIVIQGRQFNLLTKTTVIALGLFFVVLIHSVKSEYRAKAWYTGADTSFFLDLIGNRLQHPEQILEENGLFALNYRFNQGWLIAATMDRVPSIVPFANGETIWLSLLASLVPRFLWPDKPESGGALNINRFLGLNLKSTSMNISPVGEAWCNFGFTGGIVFMFFYGFSLRLVFSYVIHLINQIPTLIFWLPLLFLYVVIVESDVLTVFNHLFKTGIFIYIMYKASYLLLGQKL